MSPYIVKRNLEVIAELVGSGDPDECLQVLVRDGDGAEYIPVASIAELSDDKLLELAEGEVGPYVYDENGELLRPTNLNFYRVPGPRVSLSADQAEIRGEFESEEHFFERKQQEEWERRRDGALAPLQKYGVLLSSFGWPTCVDEGSWPEDGRSNGRFMEFEREPSLYFAVMPEYEPVRPGNHTDDSLQAMNSLWTLSQLEGREGEDAWLPLHTPLFDDRLDVAKIMAGAQVSMADLRELASDWTRSGQNPAIFSAMGRRGRDALKDETVEYLVPGLIARGAFTQFAGQPGVGKSTAMHELAVALGTPPEVENRPTSWLEIDLDDTARGLVVFMSGEDGKDILGDRLRRLDPNGNATNILHMPIGGRNPDQLIEDILRLSNVCLLIVDPVRRFIVGDEDGSGNVTIFHEKLEPIRDKFNCAIVLVNHLSKGKRPKDADAGMLRIRGSGVYVDRARAVMVMGKSGKSDKERWIGLAKSNYPGVELSTRYFRRDEDTLRQVLVEKTETKKSPAQAKSTPPNRPSDEIVVAAITNLTAQGKRVTKTGKNSLFSRKVPELEGYSRSSIEKAVEAAIDAGAIAFEDGHLVVPGTNEAAGT